MRKSLWGFVVLTLLVALLGSFRGHAQSPAPPWVETVHSTHARFTGRKGALAHFGDSITVTQAYWSPLRGERRNASPELEAAFKRVNAAVPAECWSEWKGPQFGSEGGQTVRWAHANVATWLQKLNPETAVIMFGTNDLHSMEHDEYRTKLKAVAQRCLDNGTVAILTTIPPRHGFEKKAEQFAQAVREIAADLKLPLIDYHAEIKRRRPDDWDGALDKFKGIPTYEVPTLISGDGVHPSFPKRFQNDYSEEGLRSSGYTLRSYLTLLKVSEVRAVLENSAAKSRTGGGNSVLGPLGGTPQAPALAPPAGEVIRVANPTELYAAVARVRPGGTILLAEGAYRLTRPLQLRTDHVTLRSESGKRRNVVLNGGGNAPDAAAEAVWVTACSGVTIADLSVTNVRWNGIKINSDTGVQGLRIYNCIFQDIWQRAIKGVRVPERDRERLRPRGVRIEHCLFFNTRPKQFSDDPADTPENFNGDYIGGIDVMYPSGWVIADNVFSDIQGRTRQGRGAVFLWHDARDCVVERNRIVGCDSGIALGNSQPPSDSPVHATGCIVRNNSLANTPENGILADYTRDCKILHNTLLDPGSRLRRGVRIVHTNEGLVVANNLLSGPRILLESSNRVETRNNREGVSESLFESAERGVLRLTRKEAGITDAGETLPEVREDLDRKPRGLHPDLGAYEFSPE